MVELQIQQKWGEKVTFFIHEDNNSDLMASLGYSFTEVKLGIDIVASP